MNKILFYSIFIFQIALAKQKTICGPSDDRINSFNNKIGRLSKVYFETGSLSHSGCTVTLISDKCGISAGHCKSVLQVAEFNTPMSNSKGKPQGSSLEDRYDVEIKSIKRKYSRAYDWSVIKFRPNAITSKFPGEVYGYYDVDFSSVNKGTQISITGYGQDKENLKKNFAQQVHFGEVTSIGKFAPFLYHNVDTTIGNSGATIINTKTQKVIGIHTSGGCKNDGGENHGQYFYKIQELQKAISECIEN